MPDRTPAALAGALTPAGLPRNDDHYRVGDRVTGFDGPLNGLTGTINTWEAVYDHSGLDASYSVTVGDRTLYGIDHAELRPADPAIRIHTGHDRSLTVYVNGTEVGRTDYDAVGWSGLDVVTNIVTAIADAAGLTITRTEGPEPDGDVIDGER